MPLHWQDHQSSRKQQERIPCHAKVHVPMVVLARAWANARDRVNMAAFMAARRIVVTIAKEHAPELAKAVV